MCGKIGSLCVVVGKKGGQDHILAWVRRKALILVLFSVKRKSQRHILVRV